MSMGEAGESLCCPAGSVDQGGHEHARQGSSLQCGNALSVLKELGSWAVTEVESGDYSNNSDNTGSPVPVVSENNAISQG